MAAARRERFWRGAVCGCGSSSDKVAFGGARAASRVGSGGRCANVGWSNMRYVGIDPGVTNTWFSDLDDSGRETTGRWAGGSGWGGEFWGVPDAFWVPPFSATVAIPDTTGSVPLPDSDLSAALDAKGVVSIHVCQESEAAASVLDSEASLVLVCRVGGASSGISMVNRQPGGDWQVDDPCRTFPWGGAEVDRQIAMWLERMGMPESTDMVLLAESLKIKVGNLEAVTVESGHVFGQEDLRELCRPMFERLVQEMASVLEGYGRKPDTLLLTGGSAKLPALAEAVREVAGCRVVVQ